MFSFYEFFAGGGMVRAGLGTRWECLFANDFDHKKSRTYSANWGDDVLKTCDVRNVTTKDLEVPADLVWASFPCQDHSLAGGGAGLKGERSGTFWPFWTIVRQLAAKNSAPSVIVLENVCGTLTSHKGKDFVAICSAFAKAGYRYGALVIDAAHFVPQSRPRLFVIGVHEEVDIPDHAYSPIPHSIWHSRALVNAQNRLSPRLREQWVWWSMPIPPTRNASFADIIEDEPNSVPWHTQQETRKLLDMMSPVNRAKVEDAKSRNRKMIGAIYKRTRLNEHRVKVQRAEIRFDDVAGCLRTPAGGSSRQLIMVIEGDTVRSRLISSRETARLMGLPEDYILPENYNEAYHLTGDGVVVPAVRYLASNILEPVISARAGGERAAA